MRWRPQAGDLNYFARQNGTQVTLLLQAIQAAQRAQKSAADRERQVRQLADEAQREKKTLAAKLAKVEGRLNIGAPLPKSGPAPAVQPDGASAKAMGAVKAALGSLVFPTVGAAP